MPTWTDFFPWLVLQNRTGKGKKKKKNNLRLPSAGGINASIGRGAWKCEAGDRGGWLMNEKDQQPAQLGKQRLSCLWWSWSSGLAKRRPRPLSSYQFLLFLNFLNRFPLFLFSFFSFCALWSIICLTCPFLIHFCLFFCIDRSADTAGKKNITYNYERAATWEWSRKLLQPHVRDGDGKKIVNRR